MQQYARQYFEIELHMLVSKVEALNWNYSSNLKFQLIERHAGVKMINCTHGNSFISCTLTYITHVVNYALLIILALLSGLLYFQNLLNFAQIFFKRSFY